VTDGRAVLAELLRNRRKRVMLEFDDGDLVEAILLNIDSGEHDDVIFEVIHVFRSADAARYAATQLYVAPIQSIVRVGLPG